MKLKRDDLFYLETTTGYVPVVVFLLLVSSDGGGSISKVDANADKIIASIPVDEEPNGISFKK